MVMEEYFLESRESRFSEKARQQALQTPEGLAASITTEPIQPTRAGFSDQITLE